MKSNFITMRSPFHGINTTKKIFMAISWANEHKVKGDMPCDHFGIKNGSNLNLS